MIELLQPGNPNVLVQFDQFVMDAAFKQQNTVETVAWYAPRLIVSMAYFNSLFT